MLVTLIRTTVLYIIVILCMRIMGKRQVGELQPSELVVTILISELASIPMQDLDRPVSNGIIAILVLVILELLISAVELKLNIARRIFSGRSAILIEHGKIDQGMMRRLRVTTDDLLESLRQSGVFDISDVDFAVMETSGKLSVMQKIGRRPPVCDEMGITADSRNLPVVIISDGKYRVDAFRTGQVTRDSVERELKRSGTDEKSVFLMTYESPDRYLIIKKER